jgi:MFS family permease
MATIRAKWSVGPDDADPVRVATLTPREDLLVEQVDGPGLFSCRTGPFRAYERRVVDEGDHLVETTTYHLAIPWFGWLFAPVVRATLKRSPVGRAEHLRVWWAPPDHLDARAASVMGLLAAASLIYGYVNTVFTQTVTFAADEFGSSDTAQGVAGAVVRCGIIFAVGLVFLADRKGRRRMLIVSAVLAPILCGLGAFAPSLAWLTATQTVGRPIGIALLLLIGIVAAEEMPRSSRAYAISVVAMAGGLGAGFCLVVLPLADLGTRGWRLVYVVPIVFLVVAWDLHRRLPETRRFMAPHITAPALQRKRFALLAASGLLTNLLIAPASFFNNRYLRDVRGYSASKISLFNLVTNTPGAVGVVAGGKLADVHGRRVVGAVALVAGTIFTVVQFSVGGWPMWLASTAGALIGGAGVPALGVYGAELFPTGNRGRANGLISVLSLVGSSAGLLLAGWAIDRAFGYGALMALLAIGPLVVAGLVVLRYPETAHHELEELNPEDLMDGLAGAVASSAERAQPAGHG